MKKHRNAKATRRAPTHDSGYKLLYAHAAMVRDLLSGFVPGDWVHALDLGTLERCSGSYVTDDLRDRADDLVWRLRWGDDWLYVYLLLEFQSTIDAWMAVRIQTYLGLLYQDLIRAEQLSEAGRLPPVLPIVLYNGAQVRDTAETLEPLIEPAPPCLATYRPRQGYLLLDERRLAQAASLPMRNLSAALFRLEASRGSDEALAIVRTLIDWLAAPEQTGLRRAFAVWFGRVFLPKRLPGLSFPPLTDLIEVYDMLAENLEAWTDQWKGEGPERSRSRGTARFTVPVLIASLAAVLLWLIGTAAERAGVHRRLHPGNGKRRVDSRIFLARLLLVLDRTRDVLNEVLTAIAPPDQWVASDHDGLLADGAAGG